jgi:hypothetical protein
MTITPLKRGAAPFQRHNDSAQPEGLAARLEQLDRLLVFVTAAGD